MQTAKVMKRLILESKKAEIEQVLYGEPLLLLILSGLLGITLGDTFFFAALQNIGPHALIYCSH